MKVIKLMPLLFAVFFLQACAAMHASNADIGLISYDYKKEAFKKHPVGVIVINTMYDFGGLYNGLISYATITSKDGSFVKEVKIKQSNVYFTKKAERAAPVVLMLPAGKYTLTKFRMSSVGASLSFDDRFSAEFEVKPQQISYLGEVNFIGKALNPDGLIKSMFNASRTSKFVILAEVVDASDFAQRTIESLETQSGVKAGKELLNLRDKGLESLNKEVPNEKN